MIDSLYHIIPEYVILFSIHEWFTTLFFLKHLLLCVCKRRWWLLFVCLTPNHKKKVVWTKKRSKKWYTKKVKNNYCIHRSLKKNFKKLKTGLLLFIDFSLRYIHRFIEIYTSFYLQTKLLYTNPFVQKPCTKNIIRNTKGLYDYVNIILY